MSGSGSGLDIKRKAAAQGPAPLLSSVPVDDKPGISPETIQLVRQYEEDQRRLAEQDKVDLGPLPDGVKAEPADLDPIPYRGTVTDNAKVRKAIEARCKDMDFADLVLTGRVRQVVPVIPGKISFTFQSLTGEDSFWIETNAQLEAQTEWALRSWMVWAQLTMALVSANGRDFPSHLNKDGAVDAKLFAEKRKIVLRMGAKVLDVAVVNMNWFNSRVDQLFHDDFVQLGNG